MGVESAFGERMKITPATSPFVIMHGCNERVKTEALGNLPTAFRNAIEFFATFKS